MTDVVSFLRARLDEDAAHAEEYRLAAPAYHPMFVTAVPGSERKWPDPSRVLAEVEAKRRILDEHEHWAADPTLMPQTCRRCDSFGWCATVRLLALPFASHPDYDETWRPA